MISQTIASDARAAALGDIGAATDPDVNSQSWNPAKYPFTISRAGVSLNYTPWLRQLTEGIALVNAVGYSRLGDYQALSGSIKYFTVGEVPLQNTSGSIRPLRICRRFGLFAHAFRTFLGSRGHALHVFRSHRPLFQ